MKIHRKADERGSTRLGWLDSRHTFSFGDYVDLEFQGFGPLRVINEDVVQGGSGFVTHSHQNMEILSYIVEGELQHRDSLGNGSVIRVGEIQRMSAGSGIAHSEFNPSPDVPVHFLQIWILPRVAGLEPSYEQKEILVPEHGSIVVASARGGAGAVMVHQDVVVHAARMREGGGLEFALHMKHGFWLQAISGKVSCAGAVLDAGDGLGMRGSARVRVEAQTDAHFLLFDL